MDPVDQVSRGPLRSRTTASSYRPLTASLTPRTLPRLAGQRARHMLELSEAWDDPAAWQAAPMDIPAGATIRQLRRPLPPERREQGLLS